MDFIDMYKFNQYKKELWNYNPLLWRSTYDNYLIHKSLMHNLLYITRNLYKSLQFHNNIDLDSRGFERKYKHKMICGYNIFTNKRVFGKCRIIYDVTLIFDYPDLLQKI